MNHWRLPLVLGVLAITASTYAFGVLGETESSIESVRTQLQAKTIQISSYSLFTVHELSIAGNTLKEYVGPTGTVFAVSWVGVRRPDLSLLLGRYYSDYAAAVTNSAPGHGRNLRSIHTADIVVLHGGHMRALRTRAYVPALLPTGVTPESLP